MTVDLNRLREAQDAFDTYAAGRPPPGWITTRWEEAGKAVLDAPTVWWCESYKSAYKVSCGHPVESGCRFVALVPVKGQS